MYTNVKSRVHKLQCVTKQKFYINNKIDHTLGDVMNFCLFFYLPSLVKYYSTHIGYQLAIISDKHIKWNNYCFILKHPQNIKD